MLFKTLHAKIFSIPRIQKNLRHISVLYLDKFVSIWSPVLRKPIQLYQANLVLQHFVTAYIISLSFSCCMTWYPLLAFKTNSFKKPFFRSTIRVSNSFGDICGLILDQVWSVSKLFAKVISRLQNMLLT